MSSLFALRCIFSPANALGSPKALAHDRYTDKTPGKNHGQHTHPFTLKYQGIKTVFEDTLTGICQKDVMPPNRKKGLLAVLGLESALLLGETVTLNFLAAAETLTAMVAASLPFEEAGARYRQEQYKNVISPG